MKTIVCGFAMLAPALSMPAAVLIDQSWNVNSAIPEGNPVGITFAQTFQGLASAPISDVSVALNLSGGYNGGLFGYLVLQDANGNTATEILLNEVGTSPSNPFGSAGSGFSVTLSDAGTVNGNIHDATGLPLGTWLPDSSATFAGTFGGMTANGTWTLFLADEFAGGGVSTLTSWGLEVDTAFVPEPQTTGATFALSALAVSLGLCFRRKPSPSRS
jgi:hypothetical protein